jgi:hypothetical protein
MFSAIAKIFSTRPRAPLRFFQRFRVYRQRFPGESLPRRWSATVAPTRSIAAISGM